jgi:mono/diheme cytochrome c family protein
MRHPLRFCFAVLFVSATVAHLMAQEGPAPSQGGRPPRSGQSQRGASTREFLGLGAAPDPAAAERGEKIYAPNCAFCHGAKANGASGPDLVRSPLVLHDEKGELIGPVLKEGRPDKGMPAFSQLTKEQISDVAQFLHMRVELTANRGLYVVEDIVTGDAKAGEAYFNGAGKCNTCHSPTGDLAHIANRLQPVELQSAFLWPGTPTGQRGRGARGNQVTATLATGQSIAGTLKRMDDFDVSMYDSAGVYHSWPREEVKVEFKIDLSAHRTLLDRYTDSDMHNLLAYLVTLR